MTLTDEQKQIVASWIAEGASLNDIQKRLQDEQNISLTYLDVRLLVGELNLVPKEKEKPKEPEPPQAGSAPADLADDDLLPPDANGNVSVTIDQITRPSAMISGKVTFSDGNRAEWYIDPMGRLALDPTTPGYRPSQEDIMAFQMELQRVAQKHGL